MDSYKNPRPHIYVENINGNTDKIWRGVSATNLIKENGNSLDILEQYKRI